MWLFIWLEIVWGSLWMSRIVAHYLPLIVYAIVGIISPGLRKYVALVVALETPVTLVFWAFISFITFYPLMSDNHKALKDADGTQSWEKTLNNVLVSLFIGSLVYLAERLFVQMLSVSFHRTRFSTRIKANKKAVRMLVALLDAAYEVFPPFSQEFALEDAQLENGLLNAAGNSKIVNNFNVQKVAARVNRAVGNAANMIGTIARDAYGSSGNGQRPDSSAHKIVTDALAHKASSEVLANRIWKSLVLEDSESLSANDLVDVLGGRDDLDPHDLFDVLDSDQNGDITLEEMVASVKEMGLERKRIYRNLKDMDVAITKLHSLLMFIVGLIIVIIFIGMLAPSVGTVLATFGSSLLALSFIFSTTCQEILASCVFLFVKHPLDIGDVVQVLVSSTIQTMKVTEISLLYTVLQDTSSGVIRQASNAVLNTLWIDNFSRSGPMSVPFSLILGIPETTDADIQTLRDRIDEFIAQNRREYYPNPYIQITDFPDLDRIKLCVSVTLKNNFAEFALLGPRRTKFVEFLGRMIREIPLHVPRRAETYNNPATPMYSVSATPDTVKEFNKPSTMETRHGLRVPMGMIPEEIGDETAVVEEHENVFADPIHAEKEVTTSARRESELSRAGTTLSRRASHGLRKR
jgi:small-conductance mechanosensitive channel